MIFTFFFDTQILIFFINCFFCFFTFFVKFQCGFFASGYNFHVQLFLDIINIRNEKKVVIQNLLLLLLLLLLYDLTFYGFRFPNKMNINLFKVFKSSFLQKHKSHSAQIWLLACWDECNAIWHRKGVGGGYRKTQNKTTPKNNIKTLPVLRRLHNLPHEIFSECELELKPREKSLRRTMLNKNKKYIETQKKMCCRLEWRNKKQDIEMFSSIFHNLYEELN